MRSTSIHLVHERPSRLSRVVVIVSTIGVALIAAWVFAPILLANHTASAPSGAKTRVTAQQPISVQPVTVRSPAALASTPAPAAAPPQDEAAPPAPAVTTSASSRFDTPSLAPWPTDTASAAISAPAPSAPALTGTVRTASVTPESASADAAEFVPLPRSRPSHAIALRLGIPLPRPRPETEVDIPAAEQSAFERQVDRMR
jgi:hypothetical protein